MALAQESINRFDNAFIKHYLQRMRAKLGLADEQDDDLELASRLLELMEAQRLDFTVSFTHLTQADATSPFAPGGALHDWHLRWQQRLGSDIEQIEQSRQRMQQVNPIVIPRNHLIEAFIAQAIGSNDYSGFHAMLEAVTSPFDIAHLDSVYATAPASGEVVTQTFCGT